MTLAFRPWLWAFGVALLIPVVLLGDLLGSSADSTQTFTEYYEDSAARVGGIIAALLLCLAAVLAAVGGVIIRTWLGGARPSVANDCVAALGLLGGAGLLASSGLLLAVPLLLAFGEMTGDGGIDPVGGAALAQAGTVMLLVTFLVLGAWTSLVALQARKAGLLSRWLTVAGLIASALTIAAITVGAMLPLGLWWVVFGFRLRVPPAEPN